MRRWVVLTGGNPPYKLEVSHDKPEMAVCEAPESYSTDMASYFVVSKDSNNKISVSLDPTYFTKKDAELRESMLRQAKDAEKFLEAVAKEEAKRAFNKMPVHGRFLYSVFGEGLKGFVSGKAHDLIFGKGE